MKLRILMTAVNSRLVIRHEKFKVCSKFAVMHTAFRIRDRRSTLLVKLLLLKIVSSKAGYKLESVVVYLLV